MDTNEHRGEPVFGSWYITEKLDEGAAGRLYQIRKTDELGNESYSALKVIRIPANANEVKTLLASGIAEEDLEDYYQSVIDSASSEFTILSQLKGNSNIVSYEDHEIVRHEDSFGWDILIRMEQITPLLDYSLEHELTEEQVLKMGIDVCRGLALCARHKIIHRDIKPENIFVSPDGDFKIGDFGIARIVEKTQTSLSRKGTYTYMAPEMFRGDPYTENADVYSLGLVMYRYLNNGRGPFMPDYPKTVVYTNTEKAFTERMSGHTIPEPANGSPRLKEIVLKACEYDSRLRYATATEMLEDLEELREEGRRTRRQEKKIAQLPRVRRGLYRFWKRRKKLLLTASILLLICAGAAAFAEWQGVTDIEGLDENTTILYEDTISPEYTVKPFWFRNAPVTFSSSDEDVFTVDDAGAITATGTGSAVLTMQARSYTGYAQIQVDPKVTKISGVKDLDIYTGDTEQLEPKLKPDKYAEEEIHYSSSDTDVAKVSKKGKVTAKSTGTATITLESGGTVKTLHVTVQERPVPTTSVYSGSYGSGSGNSSGTGRKKTSGSKGSGGDYFGDDEYF